MRLILDSSVLVAAERQGQNARQMLAPVAGKIAETEIGVSVVTLMELAHGATRADTPERKAKRPGAALTTSVKLASRKTGINRVSFDGHGLSNGHHGSRSP